MKNLTTQVFSDLLKGVYEHQVTLDYPVDRHVEDGVLPCCGSAQHNQAPQGSQFDIRDWKETCSGGNEGGKNTNLRPAS